MRDLLTGGLDGYLNGLAAVPRVDAVIEEMEARATRDDFPIVGRAVGRLLELLTFATSARRVMELGSGFGYSAVWFARAVGEGGEVVCTDRSADNADSAATYLQRLGLAERVRYRIGDALESFADEDGDFDVVFCDADKKSYPECWRKASSRIKSGGLYICDNVLWSGRVADDNDEDESTLAIREHNSLVAADERFLSSIIPIRDGVLVALRTR